MYLPPELWSLTFDMASPRVLPAIRLVSKQFNTLSATAFQSNLPFYAALRHLPYSFWAPPSEDPDVRCPRKCKICNLFKDKKPRSSLPDDLEVDISAFVDAAKKIKKFVCIPLNGEATCATQAQLEVVFRLLDSLTKRPVFYPVKGTLSLGEEHIDTLRMVSLEQCRQLELNWSADLQPTLQFFHNTCTMGGWPKLTSLHLVHLPLYEEEIIPIYLNIIALSSPQLVRLVYESRHAFMGLPSPPIQHSKGMVFESLRELRFVGSGDDACSVLNLISTPRLQQVSFALHRTLRKEILQSILARLANSAAATLRSFRMMWVYGLDWEVVKWDQVGRLMDDTVKDLLRLSLTSFEFDRNGFFSDISQSLLGSLADKWPDVADHSIRTLGGRSPSTGRNVAL